MTAIAGYIVSFRSMADGTLRLQIGFNEAESKQAMSMLCDVGGTVAIARLADATTEPDDQGRTQDPSPDDDDPNEGKALYGQQAKELRLSGFFRTPQVWAAIGRDAEFLDWIKTRSCIARSFSFCEGDVVAAHVRRIANGAGTGIKPGNYSAVPMCAKHHGEQHQYGESRFGSKDWWDAERIEAVQRWCWQTLKKKLGFDSWRNVPPSVLREWADSAGLLGYLPTCYKED